MNKKELLGKRLRELRKRRGINQEKLAELIDVDPTTISNIENGKNLPFYDKFGKYVKSSKQFIFRSIWFWA